MFYTQSMVCLKEKMYIYLNLEIIYINTTEFVNLFVYVDSHAVIDKASVTKLDMEVFQGVLKKPLKEIIFQNSI